MISNTDRIKSKAQNRSFIGINFRCCRVYSRIYKNKRGDAYLGWCPKCGMKIEIKVAPYGSNERFFVAI
ncbi:MAG: hypothetical protein GY855_03470 [candidate division Zixibacteria bacterium]|nr:hypothetical protein [candidate division Zixibacteria bacterium]